MSVRFTAAAEFVLLPLSIAKIGNAVYNIVGELPFDFPIFPRIRP
jgi:hypothetical protein